jgi:hypothetical protein
MACSARAGMHMACGRIRSTPGAMRILVHFGVPDWVQFVSQNGSQNGNLEMARADTEIWIQESPRFRGRLCVVCERW